MKSVTEQHSICIIDDIPAVVRGLSTRIPWEEYGIRVAATASNGEEGLQMIREMKPDIVLTDIRMPFMDGLEMMKTVLQEQPQMKLILLTGFSDFSHAQEAIKLGALELIMKPFTKDQVLESVLKAKKMLEREQNDQEQKYRLERQLRESLPFLRQEHMKLLVRYGSAPNHQQKPWDFYGIDMERRGFCVMTAEIDFFDEKTSKRSVHEVELIRFAVQNILEETIQSHTHGIVFREHIHQYIMVFNPPETLDREQLAETCRENVSRYSYQTVSIGIGTTVEKADQLPLSYAQSMSALARTFMTGGDSVFLYADASEGNIPHYSYEKEKELLYCLRSVNLDKAVQQLQEIWTDWLSVSDLPDPGMMKTMCLEMGHSIFRVFMEKVSEEEAKELKKILSSMNLAVSFDELREQISHLCRLGCRILQAKQISDAKAVVDQAIQFIDRNLHRNLTIADCAKSVHLSPSYFSNLFKKEAGTTLAQYIISRKMERARELVLEGIQVQDIAASLGYEDRPYFTELFKKHTGLTPTDFRAKYNLNES
ncbi:response regulator transcription factor [Paenibacillus lemnae]|uniref:Response regulator n=1 Tax=Paenibacillus lemnae TaxID=1330551 RepID=A0A848M7R1_PAELE|nr:response regulator [Paenibacillus lemnae]NMO97047.1 response regulator [Paenibacillus lemnae]